jgi:hypothetical protein
MPGDSTIGGHTLQTAVNIWGGSVHLSHPVNAPASSVGVVVRRSIMQSNSLTAVGGSGQVRGAGLCMQMFREVTNVSTVVQDITIGGHTVQTTGGDIAGGSVFLWCGGDTAGNVLMTFLNSIFEGNRGATLGGAIEIRMQTSFPYTVVRTIFTDCRFRNNTASLIGGAIYHIMPHAGASLELHRCTLLDNYAGQSVRCYLYGADRRQPAHQPRDARD